MLFEIYCLSGLLNDLESKSMRSWGPHSTPSTGSFVDMEFIVQNQESNQIAGLKKQGGEKVKFIYAIFY